MSMEDIESFLKDKAARKSEVPEGTCECRYHSYTYEQGVNDGMIFACRGLLKKFFSKEINPQQLELYLTPNCS